MLEIETTVTHQLIKVRDVIGDDREKAGDTLFHILIERKVCEQRIKDGDSYTTPPETQRLFLTYTSTVLHAHHRKQSTSGFEFTFKANYDKALNKISLTGGHLAINREALQGYRIGTYIMNDIVAWSKQYPNADINQINLGIGDANEDKKKIRRNRLYEQFGIKFNYLNNLKQVGSSMEMKAKDLIESPNWNKNIEVSDIYSTFSSLQSKLSKNEDNIQNLTSRNQYLESRLDGILKSPYSYALSRLRGHIEMTLFPVLFIGCLLAFIIAGTYIMLSDAIGLISSLAS